MLYACLKFIHDCARLFVLTAFWDNSSDVASDDKEQQGCTGTPCFTAVGSDLVLAKKIEA